MFYAFFRVILLGIMKILFNFSVEGTENLPKKGGYVIASNHRTYADPIFISVKVSGHCSYMAKEELFRNPFFSLLIRSLGAFPVVRGSGDMAVIDTSIDKIKAGRNLVIFPEGTRSKDGKVGRGKSGVALIASRSGADVVPVGIAYDGKLSFRKKVVVRYGKPISSEELHLSEKPSPKELRALRARIMDSITELVEKPI